VEGDDRRARSDSARRDILQGDDRDREEGFVSKEAEWTDVDY